MCGCCYNTPEKSTKRIQAHEKDAKGKQHPGIHRCGGCVGTKTLGVLKKGHEGNTSRGGVKGALERHRQTHDDQTPEFSTVGLTDIP
jgi:hypothetical protein